MLTNTSTIQVVFFLRKTEQRRIILEEIQNCSDHPTADEVYLRAKRHLPRISLGTIYRNLELMAAKGLISRLELGGGQRRYDPMNADHSHFICSICGSVEDLPFSIELPELEKTHPWVQERVIQGGRTDYVGLCPQCARSESKRHEI